MKRAILASLFAAIALSATSDARALDFGELRRAHRDILRLDVGDARSVLDTMDPNDPAVAQELGLLSIYEQDCDKALQVLAKAPPETEPNSFGVQEIARGCARVTAATTEIRDDARGIVVRLVDDADAPFVPYLLDVADAALTTLDRDLGVQLPRPLQIVVVRDHFGLSAMTGLPLESAQTTGTVAVAKWGRVTMLSPRASPHGYPWADTLMHELTHLSVTRATTDKAPLWLQEGCAKREETRWRAPAKFDDVPSPDVIAKLGFERGIALPLDKMGPSLAMLPTAEQAMVAFAEVNSFLRYWIAQEGEGALPRLLVAIGDAQGENPVDAALRAVSSAGLAEWSDRWRQYLATVDSGSVSPETSGGLVASKAPKTASGRSIAREARLGELLAERGHAPESVPYLQRAEEMAPRDPSLRARLASALRASGRADDAEKVVAALDDVSSGHGGYYAFHGWALRERGDLAGADASFRWGMWLSPLEVEVACETLPAPLLPADPAKAALCAAARSSPKR